MAKESTGPERHESFAQSSGIASTYHILKGRTTPHYAQVRTGRAECIPSDPPGHARCAARAKLSQEAQEAHSEEPERRNQAVTGTP